MGKFSLKNRKIFLKNLSTCAAIFQEKLTTVSGKFYDFLKKICRFSIENLTVFTGKSKSSNVPVKTVTFWSKFFRFSYKTR